MSLKITDNRLGKPEDNRFFQVYLEPALAQTPDLRRHRPPI